MDLFFEIRHGKTHIFCEVKESANMMELKKIICGIMKEDPKEQQLYKVKDNVVGEVLDDNMTLAEAGFNSSSARAQQPAVIAVAFRKDGKFEPYMEPVSDPPPLPDVMRSGQAETTASSSVKHEEQAI